MTGSAAGLLPPFIMEIVTMGDLKRMQLDKIDELIRQFRPIEQLFRVMGAVGDDEGGEMVRSCSDIGLSLTAKFREHLDRVFWAKGERCR